MNESTASADLRARIQAKANAMNLAFGTMFGAYAGAVFSTRIERVTSDILTIGLMLMAVAYATTSSATSHPRTYRRRWWWLEGLTHWMTLIGAPLIWFYSTGRMDLGAGILFVWLLFANIFATTSRRHRRQQRRIDIMNRRWITRSQRRLKERHSLLV